MVSATLLWRDPSEVGCHWCINGMIISHYLCRSSSSARQEMGLPVWFLSASQVRLGSIVLCTFYHLFLWNFSWMATPRNDQPFELIFKSELTWVCDDYINIMLGWLTCLADSFKVAIFLGTNCDQHLTLYDGCTYRSLLLLSTIFTVFEGHNSIS